MVLQHWILWLILVSCLPRPVSRNCYSSVGFSRLMSTCFCVPIFIVKFSMGCKLPMCPWFMGNITQGGSHIWVIFHCLSSMESGSHGGGGGVVWGPTIAMGNQGKPWMTLWVQFFGLFNNIYAFFTREIIKFFYRNGKYGQACVINDFFLLISANALK